MNAMLDQTAPVAKTARTTLSRDDAEQLLRDAAYILHLTRRVRTDMLHDWVKQAREVRQARELS